LIALGSIAVGDRVVSGEFIYGYTSGGVGKHLQAGCEGEVFLIAEERVHVRYEEGIVAIYDAHQFWVLSLVKERDCTHAFDDQRTCQPAFRNTYLHCGESWTDKWSCAVDKKCPACGRSVSPIMSHEIAPCACKHLRS